MALFILHPSQSGTEKERDTFNNQRARWKEQRTINSEWLGLSKTLNRQREGGCVCVLKGWKQAMENVTDLDIPIIHGIQMRRNLDEQILFFFKKVTDIKTKV